MNETDKDRFQIAMCALWQIHNPKGPELPIETQRGYLMAMEDLGIELCLTAFSKAMGVTKFFPKPVELRNLVAESGEHEVLLAWRELGGALDAFGRYDEILFSSGRLAATVQSMGGLTTLAQMTKKDFSTFGWHRFKDIYLAAGECDSVRLAFPTLTRIPVIDGEPVRSKRVKQIGSQKLIQTQSSSELRRIASNVISGTMTTAGKN